MTRVDGSGAAAPDRAGLSDAEAAHRRAIGQGNDAPVPQGRTYWEVLRANLFSPLYAALVAVAALLLVFELPLDALVTAGPIVVYVGIGFAQEVRAKRQLDRIALLVQPRARLVRDGALREADPAEVVLGDLLEARAGDQVLLDGTIVEGLAEVDESLLTGESEYVVRRPGEQLLSGSVIGAGRVRYRVEKVGIATYASQLLLNARRYRNESTPLQRGVAAAMAIVVGLVVLVAIPVAIGLLRSGESLASPAGARAAAVLVALVPQGLAMMIMVTYTLGALRIARRGALVQRLGAIEAMSHVDTLCLDKTGTLTTRRMQLVEAVSLTAALDDAALLRLAGRIAASASVPTPSTDAIARAAPTDPEPITHEVPFRSGRRWSGLTLAGADGGTYLLGAPDALSPRVDPADPRLGPSDERAALLAERGLRVLLLARSATPALRTDELGAASEELRLPATIEPLGLLAISEEVRPAAIGTLRAFAEAGVELRVISGDDPRTVSRVAAAVGVPNGEAANGPALGELDDAGLRGVAGRATIIGRVDPALKARIVRALRGAGRFVGMIGDGVNDILAMKQAQLGVAMGGGTSAARGVSDLVLMRDDFDVLPRVVVEGRRIVVAMQATLHLLLSRTGYLILLLAATSLLGLALPMTPRTNAALAVTTVGIPTIVLAILVPPARAPRRFLWATAAFAVPAAVAVTAVALPVYLLSLDRGVELARTALTTVTVFCGLGLITLLPGGGDDGRSGTGAGGALVWCLVAAMAGLYLTFLSVPLLRTVFELVPIDAAEVALLAAVAVGWTVALHAARRAGLARVVASWVGRLVGPSVRRDLPSRARR